MYITFLICFSTLIPIEFCALLDAPVSVQQHLLVEQMGNLDILWRLLSPFPHIPAHQLLLQNSLRWRHQILRRCGAEFYVWHVRMIKIWNCRVITSSVFFLFCSATLSHLGRRLQGTLGTTPSSTPPLPTEHIGSTVQEPSLTTGEALEKFSSVAQKVCSTYLLVKGWVMYFDMLNVLNRLKLRCHVG